mmetsp:Transcript_97047/g.280077  ORF Transcript_97047/g.280077 Transcript_97047/m.280077 type:complete len:211 (-) Transcript_97047:64-696(-)
MGPVQLVAELLQSRGDVLERPLHRRQLTFGHLLSCAEHQQHLQSGDVPRAAGRRHGCLTRLPRHDAGRLGGGRPGEGLICAGRPAAGAVVLSRGTLSAVLRRLEPAAKRERRPRWAGRLASLGRGVLRPLVRIRVPIVIPYVCQHRAACHARGVLVAHRLQYSQQLGEPRLRLLESRAVGRQHGCRRGAARGPRQVCRHKEQRATPKCLH